MSCDCSDERDAYEAAQAAADVAQAEADVKLAEWYACEMNCSMQSASKSLRQFKQVNGDLKLFVERTVAIRQALREYMREALGLDRS